MAKRPKSQRNSDRTSAANRQEGDFGGDPTSKRTWERWRASRQHLRDWRKDASENYDFVAGRQWDEEDLAKLREQQRPTITFNRTHPTISSVSGYEINNRQEVTYLPRGGDDPVQLSENTKMAEVDTAAVKFFRQECDAEDHESAQFTDALVTGYGWTEHRMDYEEDPDGLMKIERVDPLEMAYDPSARSPNVVDRAWDIRGKWWDKAKAESKWPKADFNSPQPTTYDNEDLDGQPPVDRLEAAFYKSPGVGEQGQERKDKVFILEHTWFEDEAFYSVANPATGKLEHVEPKIHDAFQEKLEAAGLPRAKSVRRTRKKFKRAFVHARDTIEEGEAPCPEGFHYQCITGYRDRNKNTWFGMVSAMKDPQRWANKWLSQFLHMLNTNVKNGLWYERGAFENVGRMEDKVAKPGFVQEVEPGYLEKIKKDEPTPIPNDAMNLMEYAVSSIRDVTGVNIELLGAASQNETAAVEAHRKQSALTILAPLFSAQRQYRKMAGRLALYFIRTYLSDGRWIRIAGSDGPRYVPLARKEESAKYDIVVDQSPMSANVKEATFAALSGIMPTLLKEGLPIPPEVLDYVPGLPGQLADKWKQLIVQKAQQPAQPDPKHQIEMMKLQQDDKESTNQDQIDRQRLAFDQQKLQFEEQERQRQFEIKKAELELARAKLDSDEHKHLSDLGHKLVMQDNDHRAAALEGQNARLHEGDQAERQRQADQEAQAKESESKKAEKDESGAKLTKAMESIHKVAKSLERAATAKRVVKRGKGGEWISEVHS